MIRLSRLLGRTIAEMADVSEAELRMQAAYESWQNRPPGDTSKLDDKTRMEIATSKLLALAKAGSKRAKQEPVKTNGRQHRKTKPVDRR